jgi:hypothetical protein
MCVFSVFTLSIENIVGFSHFYIKFLLFRGSLNLYSSTQWSAGYQYMHVASMDMSV